MAESFFSSLKKERVRQRIYKTRELARAAAPTSSITSRCSTIEPAVTAISAGSAPRHLSVPQF